MSDGTWQWDPTLFAGAARHYTRGRVPYPPTVGKALAAELGLDGTGRLLDVGCGPGSLTLLLARWFERVVAIDADPDMIDVAKRSDADNVRWLHLRAEELPADLGNFRVVTFAQSFHWMRQAEVAATVCGMLDSGGACVHVGGRRGAETDVPHEAIGELVRRYLGPVRRAGQGLLPNGTASGEDEVFRAAGFAGPRRIGIPWPAVTRDADDVVAEVFSMSSSAPHLFGDRCDEFESRLRQVLHDASPSGRFHESRAELVLTVWRR